MFSVFSFSSRNEPFLIISPQPPGASRDYRAAAFANLQVYAPPDPNLDDLFVPLFDMENYPYTITDLLDSSSAATSCDEPSLSKIKRKKKLRKAEDESAKFVIITPGVFRLPSPYIQAHLLTGFL